MAAAPFAGYNQLVLMEPAMGFGCPRLMLAPVGVRLPLPAGFHIVTPLAVAGPATRTSAGGLRAVATRGLAYFGGAPAPGFGAGAEERASRGPGYDVALALAAVSVAGGCLGAAATTGGPLAFFGGSKAPGAEERPSPSRGARFVCAAVGYGDGPVSGAGGRPGAFTTSARVLKGTGRFHASMSVVAKAGDEPTDSHVEPTDPQADSDVEKIEEYLRRRNEPIKALLREIDNFSPSIIIPAVESLIWYDDLLQYFGGKMQIGCGPLLHLALEARAPLNREAFVKIGQDLKTVVLECREGFLKAETLDRAVASLKTLRATWLGLPEGDLKPLNTSTPTPCLPVGDDPNYFVVMKYHVEEVMRELIIFVVRVAPFPRTFEEAYGN